MHTMKQSAHTLKPHHCRKSDGYIFSITTVDRSDPPRPQNPQREERGGSDFLISMFSYNAGYAKYRGVEKPSFLVLGVFKAVSARFELWRPVLQ